jgi:hypothetical protein
MARGRRGERLDAAYAKEQSPREILDAERWARDRDARNEYWHSGRRHA